MRGLNDLDIKKTLNLLPSVDLQHIPSQSISYLTPDSCIWEIPNFLSSDEISHLINVGRDDFEYIDYKKSWRLIAFDTYNHLIDTIKHRLTLNNFLDNLNSEAHKWVKPRGFVENVDWSPNTAMINTCIRINKYCNTELAPHRDASLTVGTCLRSNYTILIYLNDDFEGAETEFIIKNNNLLTSNGLTIKEELQLIQDDAIIYKIKPKAGTCVIFDHGIIHKSNPLIGTKYVLRTDLLCVGSLNNKQCSKEYREIENLTKCLFRQAQLNELHKVNIQDTTDLYDICLNLRQEPQNLKLSQIPINKLNSYFKKIPNSGLTTGSNLDFVSRNGMEYRFKYNSSCSNIFELVKIAALFTVQTLTTDITQDFIKEFNKKYVDYINFDGNSSSQYSDNMGVYNMLDVSKIPRTYIQRLLDNIKVRRSSPNRTIFDLTHPIKIERGNSIGSCTIVGQNTFDIGFDSSFYATIDRLFRLKNYKLSKVITEHYKPRPLYTLGTIYGVSCDIKVTKYFDVDCFCGMCGNKNIEPERERNWKNIFGIYKFKFETHMLESSIISFSNILISNLKTTGTIKIVAPSEYFNHASCQGPRYHRYTIYNNLKLNNNLPERYIMIDYYLKFSVNSNKIVINVIPNVCL